MATATQALPERAASSALDQIEALLAEVIGDLEPALDVRVGGLRRDHGPVRGMAADGAL